MTAHPEAVAAAARAMNRYANDRERPRPATFDGYATAAVAAAAPHIERAIREQVAAEIEAYCYDHHGAFRGTPSNRIVCHRCRDAVRGVRAVIADALKDGETPSTPLRHVRGNAEDCPACSAGEPPPYPWVCDGEDGEARP